MELIPGSNWTPATDDLPTRGTDVVGFEEAYLQGWFGEVYELQWIFVVS